MRPLPIWVGAILAFVLIAGLLSGVRTDRAETGETIVLVDLYGDNKGGDTEQNVRDNAQEYSQGREWYNEWFTDHYIVTNYVQSATWSENGNIGEAFQVFSKDQLTFTVGIGLEYRINPARGCATSFVMTYRNDMRDIVRGPIGNIIVDAAASTFSQFFADDAYGPKRNDVVNGIESTITRDLSDFISNAGDQCFIIDKLSLVELTPPESINEAVEAKLAAKQVADQEYNNLLKVKYQVQQDSMRIAQDALNNEKLERSLTPELLKYETIKRWNGVLPQYMGSNDALNLFVGK